MKEQKWSPVLSVSLLRDLVKESSHTIKTNWRDIVIKDFKEHESYLVEMIIQSDKNSSAKEFDKLSKYKYVKNRNYKNIAFKHNHYSRSCRSTRNVYNLYWKTLIKKILGNQSLFEIQKIVLKCAVHLKVHFQ